MARLPSPAVMRVELLAGLVVALALIPEAISFSLIAGVDPAVGIYASFTMAVTIAIAGGRPAMISAATGAMALVVVSLVEEHGLEYLLAATLLTGVIQVVLGLLHVPRLMRFVPRSVMTGFVNALAILIFLAQVRYIREGGALGALLLVVGLALIALVPRLTRAVPAPLVAIVVLTVVVVAGGLDLPDVGDEGELPSTFPLLGLPSVPFTLETLGIVLPYAVTLAIVGLLESLMTARLVDEITDTGSDKDREARGQGIANVVTGAFGGMAGCAMIGQTMINVRVSGARTRLSTFSAGLFLLVLCVVLGPLVAVIPMAALVAVMVLVSWSTFDWGSIHPRTLGRMPLAESLATGVTVVVTVATSNLALGVAGGVLTALAGFAAKAARHVEVERVVDPDGTSVVYAVKGELFFASDQHLVDAFAYDEDPDRVMLDVSAAHVWDASAVAALDQVRARYARRGVVLELTGLNRGSANLHDELSAPEPALTRT